MTKGHRIQFLDLRRKEPRGGWLLCRANGGRHICPSSIVYECSYTYKRCSKEIERSVFMCERHGRAFAQRHGLELPERMSTMTYRIRYKEGRTECGLSIKMVMKEIRSVFGMGFAQVPGEDLFPAEDLEIDDIVAGDIQVWKEWPEEGEEPDAVVEAEVDVEVTKVNGLAGRKVSVGEDDGDDGLGACQGHGGGRHG
jgi:hypothetical protein